MEILHQSNILTHIICGTAALLLGIVAMVVNQRRVIHKKVGKIFLILLAIVILTGLIGIFIFNRNSFLLVITALSGYYGFSGYRILQLKSNQPKVLDISIAILTLCTVVYFLYYFRQIGMIWDPIIIYSTVVTIISIISYDLLRYFIPKAKYKNLWFYEHIYKMIAAFSALLAAFTGTVFKSYQPYSQTLPSLIGIFLQIGFIVYYYQKNNRKNLKDLSSSTLLNK